MRLKKDLDNVLTDIEYAVRDEVRMALEYRPDYYGQPFNLDLTKIISDAVTRGVRVGIKELLNNQYTDEDFERDIGLK